MTKRGLALLPLARVIVNESPVFDHTISRFVFWNGGSSRRKGVVQEFGIAPFASVRRSE